MDFEEIWNRIKAREGENFITKKGLKFSYKMSGNGFSPSRTKYRISKTDVHKAFSLLPLQGPGEINNIVRGPSYVWAILHDKRIYWECPKVVI